MQAIKRLAWGVLNAVHLMRAFFLWAEYYINVKITTVMLCVDFVMQAIIGFAWGLCSCKMASGLLISIIIFIMLSVTLLIICSILTKDVERHRLEYEY